MRVRWSCRGTAAPRRHALTPVRCQTGARSASDSTDGIKDALGPGVKPAGGERGSGTTTPPTSDA
jgi:hypothetical protein